MYFCSHKIKEHENEQAQLLEMCCHAGLRTGDGKDVNGIITQSNLYEKLQGINLQLFYFIANV